jgi:hypothetical protein
MNNTSADATSNQAVAPVSVAAASVAEAGAAAMHENFSAEKQRPPIPLSNMVLFSRGAARLGALFARLKFQVACACHFDPATTRCVNRSQENAIAMGTPQNCSH